MRTLALFTSVLGTVAPVLPIALAVVILVGVLLFVIRSRRGSAAEAARTTALDVGMLFWLGLVLLLTVVPYGHEDERPPIGFIPFLDAIQRVANNQSYPSAELEDIVANVLVFMPLGIGAALRWGRQWMTRAILGAAALSFCIELTQAIEATGRFASATDVVTNTTGAALGFLLGLRWSGADDGADRAPAAPALPDRAPPDHARADDRPVFGARPTAEDRSDP